MAVPLSRGAGKGPAIKDKKEPFFPRDGHFVPLDSRVLYFYPFIGRASEVFEMPPPHLSEMFGKKGGYF